MVFTAYLGGNSSGRVGRLYLGTYSMKSAGVRGMPTLELTLNRMEMKSNHMPTLSSWSQLGSFVRLDHVCSLLPVLKVLKSQAYQGMANFCATFRPWELY